MSNSEHIQALRLIVDSKYDAIVPDTDPPQIRKSLELFAPRGPWIVGECKNFGVDSRKQWAGQSVQFFLGGSRNI